MAGAGVTLMNSVDMQEPLCATDEVAARIDAAQFALGDGPCVDAFRTGVPVLVTDIAAADETRWPVFAATIAATGARGMYAVPLKVGVQLLGVLDLYRATPGELGSAELSAILRAADLVVLTLLGSGSEEARMGHADEYDPLADTTLQRAEVHQATGMITAQLGVGAAEAFARLRAAAFAAGRPIEELAADVLARRFRFAPDEPDEHDEHDEHDDGREVRDGQPDGD
jgi:hypothetical protein